MMLFSSSFIFFETVNCRVPDTYLPHGAYFPDPLRNPLSHCFDWLGEFRRRGKKAKKILLFPILVPIGLTCGDEDLIIHSGRTYREHIWKVGFPASFLAQ